MFIDFVVTFTGFYSAAGDWLQGPYVYALYESYGMSKQDIELLFVAGFGASMVFGPIAGSLADKLYVTTARPLISCLSTKLNLRLCTELILCAHLRAQRPPLQLPAVCGPLLVVVRDEALPELLGADGGPSARRLSHLHPVLRVRIVARL